MKVRRGTLPLRACLVVALWSSPGLCDGVEAITRPSEDVTLSFVRPGRVAKLLIKEGDAVQPGQLLMSLDDAAEQANLEQLKAQAEDTVRIRAAEANLAQKRVDLKNLELAMERGAATKFEVEHAQLDVMIYELTLELARFQREQDRRKYVETKLQVDRMRLESPLSGKVEQVLVQVGESVDALAKVVRVVKIDPLWLDVPVPFEQARAVRVGQPARVAYSDSGLPVADGKVVHVAAVAEAGSGTLRVRVELPNPSGRPAGEHVKVVFPSSAGAEAPARDASAHTAKTAAEDINNTSERN